MSETVELEDFGQIHTLKAQNKALLDELEAISAHLGLEDGESAVEGVKRLKNGNTALIEALMGMVWQHFYHAVGTRDKRVSISHSHMASDEDAIDTLIQAGFAVQDKGKNRYFIEWDKLEERKKGEK